MKKRLFSLLAIATLTTTAWADISAEQLANYMKVSGADVMLENMQKNMAEGIAMRAKMRGKEIPPEVLKGMTAIFANKENLDNFTKGIKALDEKYYAQIIKFYDTKIGHKNAELVRSSNPATMQQEMVEFSKKELSKERGTLISQLVKLSMSDKKMEKMAKVMMQTTLDAMPKEMQESVKKKMDEQLAQMLPQMKKKAKVRTAYIYRDYSDDELKQLMNYYKTTSAQTEISAMMEGGTEYLKVVMPQIVKMMQSNSEKELVCNQLKSLSTSLMLFKLDNTMYPSTQEGLEALLKNPDAKKYPNYAKKAYIEGMPLVDTWGSKLIYRNDNGKIELISYGADTKEGGEKENRDILLSECKK